MRVYKFILTCAAAMFIFLRFDVVLCMDERPEDMDQSDEGQGDEGGHDTVIEMKDSAGDSDAGTSASAAAHAAPAEPVKVSASKKKGSAGVVVDLGKEKFNTFRMERYYNAETKTLDLSHKSMKNEGLRLIFDSMRHFISDNDTEILLLEDMDLTEIPYYLVTYALVDKHLKVVSFQNNRFKIPGLPVVDEGAASSTCAASARYSLGNASGVGKGDSKRVSIPIPQVTQPGQSGPRVGGGAGVVAEMVRTLWESFSPEIARELEEQKLGSESLPLFKKIIFIDRRMPPLTVFDQTQAITVAAPSKCQKFKYVVERALYTIAGMAVSFLPQMIILFTNKSGTVECNSASTQAILQACCNSSTTKSISDISDDISDKDISEKVAPSKSTAA